MSDLQARFEQAVVESKQLTSKPDNNTLLQIYSLFKQGSTGDVQGDRPGMMDFVGRAKYDAWAALKGKGQAEAQQAYIDLIASLKARQG
ncbi:acyl-CoA-binding protein [Aquabacterium olei]|uniref:Acyl-CoA-binding protein n=1 Tax=Aquabacterium olei TaxID=1296669 RepID=A0A2U8FPF3_9BURK|nr:acyl-CoA-binding protein [Aquabacterium olei]AWI52889.1 acyl-CoA-binding protein [Aquabacterium olei]